MSLLEHLNPAQRLAVEAVNGPVMIIAGAGSGKTRVLTYRVAHLLRCGVPPSAILALTFTNKAANEMKGRIIQLVGTQAEQVWMGTFHSMFARILRRECESLGYTRSFTIYDQDDSLNVVKNCMGELGISQQLLSPPAVRSRISSAKNQMVGPSAYAGAAVELTDEKVGRIYALYQKKLERSNAMDFDDLLLKPIELFQGRGDILKKHQRRFRFLLVDEFQDTNRAQYAVTRMLGGDTRNICVVGDDAQSIYAFRGADIRNILDFQKDYPECQVFRLEQNYRSTKNILAVADRLIRFNVDQLRKDLWTDNDEGDPVVHLVCTDDRDEGRQVVQAVEHEVRSRGVNLRDIAVLYRTNAQSRALEDELRRSAIPYVIVGGIRFYERREIKDILAYLRLLVNPLDDESFRRIVNVPARGVGDVTVDALTQDALRRSRALFQTLDHLQETEGMSDRGRKSLMQFRAMVLKYRDLMRKMSMGELARALVDELGFLRQFKEEGTVESMGRWENVQELLSAISEYADTKPDGSLESFLEEVSLVADIDTWEGTQNAVTLMTLHASKGLEFPVVLITGLEEGLLPFYASAIERGELEEERRLFYVGITRAQQRLYLLRASMRYRFGEPTYLPVSRFLSELGSDRIEIRERRGEDSPGAVRPASRRIRQRGIPGRGRVSPRPEREEAQSFPDYESESQETLELHRGAIVIHEQFGRGKVVQISGKGEQARASVDFEDCGVKQLILKFARLRPG